MVFGLGKKTEDTKQVSKKNTANKTIVSAKTTSQADEAAELLKKMEEKKAAGDCPFC